MQFNENEYHLPFFDEYGYARKRCPFCKEFFWTQKPDQETCKESTPEGCGRLTFINSPPTRKSFDYREMREVFLSFFEKKGHERVKPYPVVSRWRDDLYFTSASIVDFQPYVTNGIIPPPANPLVISQPCIRFVDVDNVGPTFGRHLTIFEMGGHHAFNHPEREVYWKEQTLQFHHEFVTKELGIPSAEVVYKEGVWSGGGNAGPDFESIVRGLEVDTLVFMKFKVENNEFVELPIRTVDTGYGIERFTWLSRGTVSSFHAIYDSILDEILKMASIKLDIDLLARVSALSGMLNIEKTADRTGALKKVSEEVGIDGSEINRALTPIENAFAVADHSKCLAFMLAEGVVPSNVQEGYLARLMIRRTYKLLRALTIEDKLPDIIDLQVVYWSEDYPHLLEMRDEIMQILSVEKEKFMETLKRGISMVERKSQELRAKGVSRFPIENLIELYDSHGLSPEIVQETAGMEKVLVEVPENFYTMVAKKHVQAPPPHNIEPLGDLENKVSDLPETRRLYYEDVYISKFDAQVLRVLNDKYVVLDKTAFYPEGGGQLADQGCLEIGETLSKVVDVQKVRNVIVHVLEGQLPKEGELVTGAIDWNRRISLMRHHSATHILMGAARRVLGEHAWQAGAHKGVERARLDISHFKRLSPESVREIERLANEVVMKNVPVETSWMPRQEAEKLYGFRLYQGGVVPGKEIRIVRTQDWEVEACGGTHCKSTGEVGLIKIMHTERIQDGVERIVFSAGLSALNFVQKKDERIQRISEIFNVPIDKVEKTAEDLVYNWKESKREREKMIDQIADFTAKEYKATGKEIKGLKVVVHSSQGVDVDVLIKVANKIVTMEHRAIVVLCGVDKTARIVVRIGKEATKRGVNAIPIANVAATVLGGRGSGRPDFAQGGGTQIKKVPEAIQKAEEAIERQLT